MSRSVFVAAIAVALNVGCGSGGLDKEKDPVIVVNNGNNSDTDAGMNLDATGGDDASTSVDLGGPVTDPDGPEIIEFSANPDRIAEDGTVNITVLLNDPQGFADIGGGRLLDASGNVLGLFEGSGGSYSFALTWGAINANQSITFDTEARRIYTAEFFDASGNRGRQSFAVTLYCEEGASACDGICGLQECDGRCVGAEEFVDDPDNCGMCGRVCDLGICLDGECTDCAPIDPPVGQCSPMCQTGCEADQACYFGGDPNNPVAGCGPAGPGTQGDECDVDSACQPGYNCVQVQQEPQRFECLQFCRADQQPDCPASTMCVTLPSSGEVGLCIPSN